MDRFWTRYIEPVVRTVQPRQLLEIRTEAGPGTAKLLAYCKANNAHAHIIVRRAGGEALAPYSNEHILHQGKSTQAIPQIRSPDIALVDGDPNWLAVYNELTAIFARAREEKAAPPLVFVHNTAWPYGRRDMYPAPEELDQTERHPYAYRGVRPGSADLTDEGLNAHFAHALHEGGPRNGVLTAVEDFLSSSSLPIRLHTFPFFNGLAILVPEARQTPALQALIDSFFTPEALTEALAAVEEQSMRTLSDLTATQARLTRRTEALARAHRLLAEKTEKAAARRTAGLRRAFLGPVREWLVRHPLVYHAIGGAVRRLKGAGRRAAQQLIGRQQP